jgi:hypothetical protein
MRFIESEGHTIFLRELLDSHTPAEPQDSDPQQEMEMQEDLFQKETSVNRKKDISRKRIKPSFVSLSPYR